MSWACGRMRNQPAHLTGHWTSFWDTFALPKHTVEVHGFRSITTSAIRQPQPNAAAGLLHAYSKRGTVLCARAARYGRSMAAGACCRRDAIVGIAGNSNAPQRENAAMSSECKPNEPSWFTIRMATNDDLPAIRTVLLTVRREFGVVDETDVSDNDLDDLELRYFRRGGVFEVIEEAATKRIVGCAGLYPLSPCRAELCKMYILKSARGQGFGRRLLEDVLAAARGNGFVEVWLETNRVLTAATNLYKKYGFEPVLPAQLLPRCDVAYLLRLNPAQSCRSDTSVSQPNTAAR